MISCVAFHVGSLRDESVADQPLCTTLRRSPDSHESRFSFGSGYDFQKRPTNLCYQPALFSRSLAVVERFLMMLLAFAAYPC